MHAAYMFVHADTHTDAHTYTHTDAHTNNEKRLDHWPNGRS